ncbi:MAG: type I-MYXAN CRISPR-associated Cas8a1/Cmx1 [Pyrinomonadaceae bacterium]
MSDLTAERSIDYRLTNPGYTIYHRAALGGLAATVRAWDEGEDKDKPEGIAAELHADHVRLSWKNITEQEALRRILDASFKLTSPDKPHGGKLIDLPGHGIKGDDDLRLAIHTGLLGTFLQHNKMRPGEKEPRRMTLSSSDNPEESALFTYKAVDSYAHQRAQGTGLLDEKLKGAFPARAAIPQSVVPGAMSGASELEASPEEAVLLLFLMVGCAVFLLRPRENKERARYCIVVPDVVDLDAFADELRHVASMGREVQGKRFKNTYLNRVVGGAEEAALNFLIDMEAGRVAKKRHGIAGCVAIAMGKVAWDANQINRSVIVKVGGEYGEIEVFRAAKRELGGSRTIKLKSGEGFAVPMSPIPELAAANLARGHHWYENFSALVSDKDGLKSMRFARKGLIAMSKAIKDVEDQAIIRTFHKAWEMKYGQLSKRASDLHNASPNSKQKEIFGRLSEVEREKVRNAILRTKTSEKLGAWFLGFCADATKGASIKPLRDADEARRVREFIFNPRNFERFQNLCLFSLVSYAGKYADTDEGNKEGDE